MSTEQVAEKAKQTLKTVRELLEKSAPAVQKSIDTSLEAASKEFNATTQSD